MSLRFRRSIKILPFLKIDLGKKGVSSISVGGKGLHISRSKNGTRVTTGIPGTGLSDTQYFPDKTSSHPKPPLLKQKPQPILPPEQHIEQPIQRNSPPQGSNLILGMIIGITIMLILMYIF